MLVPGLQLNPHPNASNGVLLPQLASRVFDYYRRGPASGEILDRTAFGNDLVFNSGWYVTADGIGDNVAFPHTTDYDLDGVDWTISFVFRISGKPGGTEYILAKGCGASSGGWGILIDGGGKLKWRAQNVSGGLTHGRTIDSSITYDIWHLVSLSGTGGVLLSATIDGVDQTFGSTTGPTSGYVDSSEDLSLMARLESSVASDFFTGDLCAAALTINDAVVGDWPLQDFPTGTLDGYVAFDRSGNANHGAYVGCEAGNGAAWPVPQMYLQDWNRNTVIEPGATAYIPASLSDPSLDATGNDIDNLRGKLLNLTGEAGDYAEIADSASLDVTTQATWVIAGNFWDDEGGVNRFAFHRYDDGNNKRLWTFGRNAGNSVAEDGTIYVILSSDGTSAWAGEINGVTDKDSVIVMTKSGTTLTAYIDGVETTITTVAGSLPASLFTTDTGIRIGQDFDGLRQSDKQMMPPLFYNTALSEAEVIRLSSILTREYL